MSNFVAIGISAAALLFAISSFWYMNWRKGVLKAGGFRYFVAGKGTHGNSDNKNLIIVELQIVFFNTGASPVVVEDIRLNPRGSNNAGILDFEGVDTELWVDQLANHLEQKKIERNYFFLPVLIKPNQVIKETFVFQRVDASFLFEAREYEFDIEVITSDTKEWHPIKRICLNLGNKKDMSEFALNEYINIFPYEPNKLN